MRLLVYKMHNPVSVEVVMISMVVLMRENVTWRVLVLLKRSVAVHGETQSMS